MRHPVHKKMGTDAVKHIIKGTAGAVGTAAVLCAVLAWAIGEKYLKAEMMKYGGMIIPAAGAMVGAKVTLGGQAEKSIFEAFISGTVFYGIMLLISRIAFQGAYRGMLPTGLMVFCGVGVAIIMNHPTKKRQRGGKLYYSKRKYA